jgi:hypothetical protein
MTRKLIHKLAGLVLRFAWWLEECSVGNREKINWMRVVVALNAALTLALLYEVLKLYGVVDALGNSMILMSRVGAFVAGSLSDRIAELAKQMEDLRKLLTGV